MRNQSKNLAQALRDALRKHGSVCDWRCIRMVRVRKRGLLVAILCFICFHYLLNAALLSADIDPLPTIESTADWKIDEADASILYVGVAHPPSAYHIKKQKIGIITIVDTTTTKGALKHAMTTLACYAKAQRYEYRVVNESFYYDLCKQTQSEFRRHCIISLLLPNYDFILFLDANIGVVNPRRRIEEFIDDDADVVFYDRFHPSELMPGSYLVKNTKWARHFLKGWANYEQRLPHGFHGGDSVALYFHLAETVTPDRPVEIAVCRRVWSKCHSWRDVFVALSCMRNIIGETVYYGKVKILAKGTGWARDSFVTDGMWSPRRDFMLYDMEPKRRRNPRPLKIVLPSDADPTYSYYGKFAGQIHLRRCYPGNTTWRYEPMFFIEDAVLEARYRQLHREIHYEKIAALSRIHKFLRGVARKAEKYILRESGWRLEKKKKTLNKISAKWLLEVKRIPCEEKKKKKRTMTRKKERKKEGEKETTYQFTIEMSSLFKSQPMDQ
ncbi:hypothetical protein Y032_0118g722 [Ancylostoma ceylanicum]|uniref:Nucleotide-diphospho-sugar transferase domain-containing protein n=1 Tax=Ancylostoma ceylanicum TaxID=53326 RepID=A0A016TBI6_9BILA|nr:hypothetical protein Y032_0118g722 [Ancylostoma ceylanicum]